MRDFKLWQFNFVRNIAIGALFIVFAHPLVAAFTDDPEVLHECSRALWIVSLAFPLYAIGMCVGAAFNGAGDTWTPTLLNFFCLWLGQIPLAWLLSSVLGFGSTGVFIAVAVSFVALTALSFSFFVLGKWKEKRV